MKNFLRWAALPFAVIIAWYLSWLINSWIVHKMLFFFDGNVIVDSLIEFCSCVIATFAAVLAANGIAPKAKDTVGLVVAIFCALFAFVSISLAVVNNADNLVKIVFGNIGMLFVSFLIISVHIKELADNSI